MKTYRVTHRLHGDLGLYEVDPDYFPEGIALNQAREAFGFTSDSYNLFVVVELTLKDALEENALLRDRLDMLENRVTELAIRT